MNKTLSIASRTLPIAAALVAFPATAQQVPNAQPDRAVSAQDRFYTSDQFSNTVSVIDPSTNTLLGVIKLGDPTPANLSPLYRGQLLVHGMGFSPDRRTLAVVSIGSNSVSFIDTATNAVKHTAYVGRSPHEAFFRPDGREALQGRVARIGVQGRAAGVGGAQCPGLRDAVGLIGARVAPVGVR